MYNSISSNNKRIINTKGKGGREKSIVTKMEYLPSLSKFFFFLSNS